MSVHRDGRDGRPGDRAVGQPADRAGRRECLSTARDRTRGHPPGDRSRLALREPQLAVLSVLAHGGGEVTTAVAIGRAAIHAIFQLPEEQRLLYSLLIEQALSEAARKALEMEPHIEKFFSEAHRRSYAEGEVKGEAKALLLILKQRGMAMTDDQQRRIVTCTDLATVDRWLDRAFSVASVDELLT